MNRRRNRLLGYILLNIVISALTTLIVLALWQRAHPSPDLPAPQPGGQLTQPTLAATAQQPAGAVTLVPSDQALITIESVFAAGNLAEEYAQMKNDSPGGSVLLAGWTLDDGSGSPYAFPALTLNPGSSVRVHTAAGIDTVTDLYWGREQAAWKAGKTVRVLDDQGELRASFEIR